jgi:nucleoside-diphosphate-sugar epimerase
MRFLFIHQNFPGQFKHLAPALAAQGHEVVGLSVRPSGLKKKREWRFRHSLSNLGTTCRISNLRPTD